MTAAHQIAINFAATMFMIPLALSCCDQRFESGTSLAHWLAPKRARYAGAASVIIVCGAIHVGARPLFMLVVP